MVNFCLSAYTRKNYNNNNSNNNNNNNKQKQPPRGFLKKRCSKKYGANLQENTHAEVRFATLLKSHFDMGVLL